MFPQHNGNKLIRESWVIAGHDLLLMGQLRVFSRADTLVKSHVWAFLSRCDYITAYCYITRQSYSTNDTQLFDTMQSFLIQQISTTSYLIPCFLINYIKDYRSLRGKSTSRRPVVLLLDRTSPHIRRTQAKRGHFWCQLTQQMTPFMSLERHASVKSFINSKRKASKDVQAWASKLDTKRNCQGCK